MEWSRKEGHRKCLAPTVCKPKCWALQVHASHGGGVSNGQIWDCGPGLQVPSALQAQNGMRQGDYEQGILGDGWVDRQERNREGQVGVRRGGGQLLASMRLWMGSGP